MWPGARARLLPGGGLADRHRACLGRHVLARPRDGAGLLPRARREPRVVERPSVGSLDRPDRVGGVLWVSRVLWVGRVRSPGPGRTAGRGGSAGCVGRRGSARRVVGAGPPPTGPTRPPTAAAVGLARGRHDDARRSRRPRGPCRHGRGRGRVAPVLPGDLDGVGHVRRLCPSDDPVEAFEVGG